MEALDLRHIREEFRPYATLSDEERIRFARTDLWIPYSEAEAILSRCESILDAPRSIRPENLLLVAPSNNGKSSMLRQFRDRHPPDDNPGGDAAIVPVLLVENPPKPEEGRFYEAILQAINAPHKIIGTAGEKEALVRQDLTRLQTRVLLLDEFHDVLAGGPRQQQLLFNVLKKFGNTLQISIIAAGTGDAESALRRDIQLDNRFEKRPLNYWGADRAFAQMVLEIVSVLPLRKPSTIKDPAILRRIHARSQGTLGGINAILRKAAIYAIKNGIEYIDLNAIENSEYQEPSVSAAKQLRRK